MGKNLQVNIRVFDMLENHPTEAKMILSKDGYLEYQGGLDEVRFGNVTAKYGGCGAIASWNILKYFNKAPGKATVFDEMEAGQILGGKLGVNIFFLKKYLISKGLRVDMYFSVNCFKEAAPEQGIIYYMKKDMKAHFVAFTPAGVNDKGKRLYRFHNTSIGSYWKTEGGKKHIENLPLTMDEFLAATEAMMKVCYNVYF